MQLLKKLLRLAGLLALLLIVTGVHAQQPIVGGTLYSAAPGPVTMQLLGYNVPSSVNFGGTSRQISGWETFASWVSGPGFGDWRSTRGNDPVTGPLTPSGTFGGGFSGYDATAGRTISTPALSAGTLTTMASAFYFPGTPQAAFNDGFIGVVHTGWSTGPAGIGAFVYWSGAGMAQSAAMIFPGQDNTALIGFMLPGMTASSNFLDYSVQILVGNVCVR